MTENIKLEIQKDIDYFNKLDFKQLVKKFERNLEEINRLENIINQNKKNQESTKDE